jgi:hypothetical protein
LLKVLPLPVNLRILAAPNGKGKSMKAVDLAVSPKDCWRNIAISLIDPVGQFSMSVIEYAHCRRIYLSWDSASWHVSKKLKAHLGELNRKAADEYPIVQIAPPPAGAQFLNVIESVFSGMARAIIHNSDYESREAAKRAIDRYFQVRNSHFRTEASRAGKKIWQSERAPCEFSESNNCKDPLYR